MGGKDSTGNADLWRGSAIAVALIGLVLAVFVGIANSRLWSRITAPRRVPVSVVPMVPGKNDLPSLHALDMPGPYLPRATAAGSAPVAAPAASAGGALRQALANYRPDANRTATVTITTGGHVRVEKKDEQTEDGMPVDEVRDATLVTGAAPHP